MLETRETGGSEVGGSALQSESEWSIRAVQNILWQRRWLVLVIAAEVFMVTSLVTFLRTPQYEASARVMIERATPQILDSQDVMPMAWNEFEIQRFYQTQYLLIRDPDVLIRTLDHKHYPLRVALMSRFAGEDDQDDGVGEAPPTDVDLAKWIRKRLEIQQLEYSNVVKVSFRDSSPELAAQIVNSVVHNYQDYFVEEVGLAPRKEANKFLEEAIKGAQSKLLETETHLRDANIVAELRMSASESEMGSGRLKSLYLRLTDAKARRVQAEATRQGFLDSGPNGIASVRNNPQVQNYREQITTMQQEIAQLEGKVGPDWPRLKELKAAIVETRYNLGTVERELYARAIETAGSELAVARRHEEQLASLLDSESVDADDLRVRSQKVDGLRRAYEQQEQVLKQALARRDEMALGAELEGILRQQIVIVGEATAPEQPAVPRVKLNLALGMLFGLFLGVGAAFLAEAMDNKIRGGAHLSELTRLPLIGTIPRVEGNAKPRLAFARKKGKKKGNSPGTTPVMSMERNHDVEESFRAMRSALLLSQADHPPRSLMVTSALPGEGKSTIAANLGRTLAAFGARTVLIDADLRHPRLHRVFKGTKDRGLTNILASSLTVDEVLYETPYKNLSLIPGGPCPPDPATLLDRDRLRALIADLTGRLGFEFVIVDTPPVLVFADSFNIVPATEATIFVARSMSTHKDAVKQAMESLRKVKARFVGAVLNGEIAEEHSGSYYRYYNYRRGYYRKAAEARAQEAQPERDPEDRHQAV